MTSGNALRHGLGPEDRFLLLACSVADRATRMRSLAGLEGLDGERLVTSALKNRVVPLVQRAVHELDGAGLDEGSRALLEHYARRHQSGTLVHIHELLRILDRCRERGVRAVPYKGPILAATLYDDLVLRQYYDLDVLVRPEDVAVAREVVLALGFRPTDELDDAAAERKHLREDCELHFHHPVRDLLLELHWETLPRRHRGGFAVEDVWERFVPLTIAGREVEGFGPEDLLLVLCIHGGEKHRWNRLQMVADVARILIRYPDLDWRLLLARAAELGREETVLLGALCAWLLLDAPLPPDVIERLAAAPHLLAQAAATTGRIFRTDSGLVGFTTWRRYADELVARTERAAAPPGLRHYLGVVLRPEWVDRQALSLPGPLSFLYWVYRPWRLFRRHGFGLLGRL